MNRNPQNPPRVMPVGYGTPNVVCAGPCNDGPINIHLKEPTIPLTKIENQCEYLRRPMPSYEQAKQNISCFAQNRPDKFIPSPCSNVRPINVNLKMCPVYSPKDDPQPCVYEQEKDCFSECHPIPKPPRCPDGNYAERAVSMRPIINYVPMTHVFDDKTTYKTFFQANPPQMRVQMYKPVHILKKSEDKLDDQSLYKVMFKPFPVAPYKKPNWAEIQEFHPNEGAISSVTSYNMSYQGGTGKPATSTKTFKMMDPERPHLDTRTTYKCDYKPFTKLEFASKIGRDNRLPSQCVPFHHVSTYQSDFIKLHGVLRRPMKRTAFVFGDRYQKTGSTTYKTEYEPFYYTKRCEDNDMPTIHYDQIYPRTCHEVNCFCSQNEEKKPFVRLTPPCPPPDHGSIPSINENYKVKVTNEDNQFEPTEITVTSIPTVYTC